MHKWLNISEPTTEPTPSAECVTNNAMKLETTSGLHAPAAINVAPATSSGILSTSHITASAGTKRSSHTTERHQKTMATAMTSSAPSRASFMIVSRGDAKGLSACRAHARR